MLTKLFFLGQLQAYSTAFVYMTRTAKLTKVCVWDVIAVHSHTCNVLPYTATTVLNHFLYLHTGHSLSLNNFSITSNVSHDLIFPLASQTGNLMKNFQKN